MRYYDYQLVLLSRATGSVSSGNLSALTSLTAKRAKLPATIVTIGKEESCPWQHRNFKRFENFLTKAPSRLAELSVISILFLLTTSIDK